MRTTLIRTVAVVLVLAVTAIPAGARTVIQNKGSDTLVNVGPGLGGELPERRSPTWRSQ